MLRIQSQLLPPGSARGVDLCEAVTRVCVPAYLRGTETQSDHAEEL